MKINLLKSIMLMIAIMLGVTCAFLSHNYFPALDDFSGRWYTEQLRALKEPFIFHQSNDKNLKIFRFTWLRTFHKPISIRIVINNDTTAALYAKMASGAGGYDPGRLEKSINKELDKSEVKDFLKIIEAESFWNIPTIEQTEGCVLDGAQWIIEGLMNGKYHMVDWCSPEEGSVRNIGLYFLKLSGFEVDKIY